ncbi:MAG: zinc-binding dehydrogenase [Solirubrobacterales bacterium]|nr:zinc-binding dehydrogenase [Solirubrobacterales bacterium]
MRAVVYDAPRAQPRVEEVPEPGPGEHGAVVRVVATGVCRSDWHGFVCACGTCAMCAQGDGQVCERQTQPGFMHWGSWAELVRIDHADVNLVALPDDVEAVAAAALGCRVATAFRAVVDVGRVAAGEWVAVHGCGGVGLAAILVAAAAGARVVALDPDPRARELAAEAGADVVLDAADGAEAVRAATGGGAHLSLDAIGDAGALDASLEGLRRRGRHVQVGLLPDPPPVPMHLVIAGELAVLGSHGMPAHAYPRLLALGLPIGRLVTRRIGLDDAPAALVSPAAGGITVIEP